MEKKYLENKIHSLIWISSALLATYTTIVVSVSEPPDNIYWNIFRHFDQIHSVGSIILIVMMSAVYTAFCFMPLIDIISTLIIIRFYKDYEGMMSEESQSSSSSSRSTYYPPKKDDYFQDDGGGSYGGGHF